MAKYTVLQPVSYVRDGAAVHQTAREVGDVIDLDDAQAAPLVEAGALEALGIPGATGTVLDGVLRNEPEPAADTPRGRSRRTKDDDGESA